jgi:hypothetical protein
MMSKAELVAHIAAEHPEMVYPPVALLRRWPVGQIAKMHGELHAEQERTERPAAS